MDTTILEKAKKIKLLLLDVDGVLTDGRIIIGNNGEEFKAFDVHDGQGITLLQSSGIKVGIITKRSSNIVVRRAAELNIQYVYQGQQDKLVAFLELIEKLKLSADEVAYMGDDIADLVVLNRVGLATSVKNAMQIVREQAHWISQKKGGRGAVRELCELIIAAQSTAKKNNGNT